MIETTKTEISEWAEKRIIEIIKDSSMDNQEKATRIMSNLSIDFNRNLTAGLFDIFSI